MKGQQKLDLGNLSSQQFSPVPIAQEGAKAFTAARGGDYKPVDPQLHQDPAVGYAVGREYQGKIGSTPSPRLQRSYEAMRSEVHQQYDFMTKPKEEGGMGLQHEVTPHDPYPSVQHMAADVAQGRIKSMSTETTGGHGFFTNEDNDKFRAVHDLFGHAATGRGFSRHGEEAAWRSHVQMFSPEAREAMTSETRGQNSLMNYSPRGGFVDQAEALVPMSRAAQNPDLKGIVQKRSRPTKPKPQGVQNRFPGMAPKRKLP